MTLAVVITLVAGVFLALIIGIAINLYSDVMKSRYPQISEFFTKRFMMAGGVLLITMLIASILSAVSSRSLPSGHGAGAPETSSRPPQGQSPASPAPDTPSPSTPDSKQPSSIARHPKVQYEGEITIAFEVKDIFGAKDLDQIPPANADWGDGGDFNYNAWNGKISAKGGATLALWGNDRKPSYSDCAERAVAASMSSIELNVGDTVCARTGEGRIARMKAPKYCDGYCGIFDVTVWELS
jgi:hypothetical protein